MRVLRPNAMLSPKVGSIAAFPTRSFLAVWLSVFLVMLGVGLISPILPLYVKAFGASYSMVGLTISAFGIARLIFDIPTGHMADMFGRRRLMLAGTSLFALAGLIAAYAKGVIDLIIFRFVQGVGAAMLTTAALAMIGDLAPPEKRGRYLGYYQGAFFLGTATGPALGGLLYERGDFATPFIGLSLMSAISAVHIYFTVSEPPGPRRRPAKQGDGAPTAPRVLDPSILIALIGALIVFATTSGVRLTAIPLYAEKAARLSPGEVGIILSIAALANVVAIPQTGAIADRLGGRRVLPLGFLATAVTTLMFAYAGGFYAMAFVAALYGLGVALILPAQTSTVMAEAHPGRRGLVVGIYRVFADLGLFIGPVAMGAVADALGLSYMFYAMAGASAVGAALHAISYRKGSAHPEYEQTPHPHERQKLQPS